MKKVVFLISMFIISSFAAFNAQAETPNHLDGVIDKYFKGKSLTKTDDITFDVAKRALDGTQVPFSFTEFPLTANQLPSLNPTTGCGLK